MFKFILSAILFIGLPFLFLLALRRMRCRSLSVLLISSNRSARFFDRRLITQYKYLTTIKLRINPRKEMQAKKMTLFASAKLDQ